MMPYSGRASYAPIFGGTFLLWMILELIASRTKRSGDRSHSQSGQKVVDSGPYRHLRHPSYAGALIHHLGSCFKPSSKRAN